jgi:signal transduction histidine kinase
VDSRILFPFPLVLHTFAAYSFCLLSYLQLRQYRFRSPSWGGWPWRALTAVFAAIYVSYLSGYLTLLVTDGFVAEQPLVFRVVFRAVVPFVGPLLMHVFYEVERDRLPGRKIWAALAGAAYAVAVAVSAAGVLLNLDVLPDAALNVADYLGIVSDATLAAAGLYAAAILWASRRQGDSLFRRRQRQWHFALLCAMEAGFTIQALWDPAWFGFAFGLLPVAFMLATVYYGERLVFWDVFAKRGLFFFLALLVLTGHIAVLGPYLDLAILGFAKSWIIALSILPLVAAAPGAYSRLNGWVDRVILGRRFSSIDAVRHFSESLHAAVDEEDLLERAASSLRDIFRSDARVDRGDTTIAAGELRSLLFVNGSEWGAIRILPRADEIPFLSQDAELLDVLARSLESSIESENLRSQTLLQQQRERELALTAVQSELKALRAQINPHFLFNALNTIASLIPRKPEEAEQTVEQLSEVFRYTVRHSDREWVRLDDEISFVNAYLDIERARFGERLQVRVDVEDAARGVHIPAMVVQTLVENAVKHGVAAVRGPGQIAISARVDDSRLRVAVEDSGPGFAPEIRPDSLPEPSRGGYGLRNVRERLKSYYGPSARLAFRRSPAGLTEVAFEIPLMSQVRGGCVS